MSIKTLRLWLWVVVAVVGLGIGGGALLLRQTQTATASTFVQGTYSLVDQNGAPVDQTYWLGARVRDAKITFFGFFRTEADALEAVT